MKHKVVMRNLTTSPDGDVIYQHEAVDYVPEEQLTAYVADARTRWAEVTTEPVSEEPAVQLNPKPKSKSKARRSRT